MGHSETRTLVLRFEDGTKEKGVITTDHDKTKIRILLPYLNSGALMRYVINYENSYTESPVCEAEVVCMENDPEQKIGEPLSIRVILKCSDSALATLPNAGMHISLMPKGKKAIFNSKCIGADPNSSTFCVVYKMYHVIVGYTADLFAANGIVHNVTIDEARLCYLSEDSNTAECVLSSARIEDLEEDDPDSKTIVDHGAVTKEAEEKKEEPANHLPDDIPSPETTPPDIEKSLQEDDLIFDEESCKAGAQGPTDPGVKKSDTPTQTAEQEQVFQKPSHSALGKGTKITLQLLIGLLFLVAIVIALVPNRITGSLITVASSGSVSAIATSTASSTEIENNPNSTVLVMISEESKPKTIPMTPKNLRAFYFQSNPGKMLGSVIGDAQPNRLGILCETKPEYEAKKKTSDVSDCKITIPKNAKPGVYKLTAKNSRAWFHQEDPTCFVEAVLPYYSSPEDIRNGLRVNAGNCDWCFDPVRKCFDFSKCTFTVPQFTAE
ncbi:MAG: hypothetical protein P1P90_04015 [Patescibacteria group bacterium]|nr:hypothetical protein [Patescibacteria group bacterium]